ncbi:MAG: CDGSH iron-sulfur domain-containing protein, partial [Ignavibacteria bacterium]|nr:CDGSH iron-sulfur domain-containing protein [Ignavibacteria bacterium]
MDNGKIFQKAPIVKDEKAGVYYWCACGLSSSQPFCDGSHKSTEFNPMPIELKEDNFADKGKFDYAPKNIADAKDSYNRILEIAGDIAGNIIAPKAAEADEEGAHFENGVVTYAKATQEAIEAFKKADLMGFTLPRKYGGLNCPVTIYTI